MASEGNHAAYSPGGSMQATPSSRASPIEAVLTVAMPETKDGGVVPHGMDTASFMAGERSAYASAFAAALPSQQALGQLFSAVETLHSRLEEDAAVVGNLRVDLSYATSSLDSVTQRVTSIEHATIPAIQQRCDDILARPVLPQEVVDALHELQHVLGGLTLAQQQYLEAAAGYSGPSGFLVNQLKWLITTGVRYAGSAISNADVAAVFLSRKVLVGNVAAWQGGLNTRLRAALGASLFVACVEATWHLHGSAARRLPRSMTRFGAPLRTGLKVVRGLVWTSAIILALWEVRRACESVVVVEDSCEKSAQPGQRTPVRRPASAGSPPPPRELMRDNFLYDNAAVKDKKRSATAKEIL